MADTIKLPERLDLPAAQPFIQEITQKDLSAGVVLDASDVTHLGALCVQAMLVSARASKAAGGDFKLENVSEKVEAQLSVMGLSVADVEGGMQ